jgi:hypothetical protein
VPLFVNKAVFLLLVHLIVDELMNNSIVQDDGVLSISVVPGERLLDSATRSKDASRIESAGRRCGVKPAIIVLTEWVQEMLSFDYPLIHGFGETRRSV